MTITPSPEQLSIFRAADEVLAREITAGPSFTADRRALEESTDRLWSTCAGLGWLGLAIPEDLGGLGLGAVEEAMLFRALGRHVAPGPFRSSVLGAHVAALAGDEQLTAAIVTGRRRVGMLTGSFAVDARRNDLVLALVGESTFLREAGAIEHQAGVDPLVLWGTGAPGEVVAHVRKSVVIARTYLIVAAELLGVIEAVRDMSAAYARTRVQFGNPIGAFQAVKHRCADMAVAAHATLSQVLYAGAAIDAGDTQACFHASAAYVLAAESAAKSAADNVQNHGGMGFTWEHRAHLYLKRAFFLERVLGSQRVVYQDVLAPARHEFG